MKKLFLLFAIALVLSSCGAGRVARQELDARTLLTRYEWFKDAASQIEAKMSTIQIYQASLEDFEKSYEGVSRRDWDSQDRNTYNQKTSELNGIRASCNLLIAEYNSNMAKINWKYTNIGELPAGEDAPLPREYASCQ